MIIIKLGETILPSVGISSLNNFYSKSMEDDWFFDDVIPKGFSFDSMMLWACKTPLGRKEWRGLPRQEYIMTIDVICKRHLKQFNCKNYLYLLFELDNEAMMASKHSIGDKQ